MIAAEIHQMHQVSTHPSYHGWPSIARRADGELLVVASAGRVSHVCPFGQVHLMRSSDEGQTWSQTTVVNGPLDDRDAGVLITRKGTVLINWFTSVAWRRRLQDAEAPEDLYTAQCRKIDALLNPETVGRELSPWLIRSEDGGTTWSEKINPCVGAPHGPTELDDGRLLYVGNPRFSGGDTGLRGSPYDPGLAVSESTDDGRSWATIARLPIRAGDDESAYHEPHVVQAADGRVLVHIRNHNEQDKHQILQCASTDGGRTWTPPASLDVFGYPCHLLRLADGRLLSTYGYRHHPYGNRAILSADHGRTWSSPLTLTAEERGRDIGYPATVEMPDQTFITVWYEFLHHLDRAVIRMARWSLRESS